MENLGKPLVNKVAMSKLVTLNMEEWYPAMDIKELDLKSFLFHELILKEKEFRQQVRETDWSEYSGAVLCIHCSTDAIIPVWAFMLIAASVEPYVDRLHWGDKNSFIGDYYKERIDELDVSKYEGRPIVIKGCSEKMVPPSAYMHVTSRLKPVVQSLMYGEPCSTVPVYKKKKQ